MATAQRPWEALPPEVASVLRPELPALADEIVAAISEGVPDYAQPLEGPFGRGLRAGVEEALRRFAKMVDQTDGGREPAREVYVNLGRGEMRAGRTLDALLAAYRLGARVAWRRLAAAGAAAGLEPEILYLLAESIFAYIDELSAESAEGYAQEQSAAAGEAQQRRWRLVGVLIGDPPPDRATAEAAAADANWELPRRLAALAMAEEDSDRVARRLGSGAIAAPVGEISCALLPDAEAPGRRRQIERALAGEDAALGPTVGWEEAGLSFGRACSALRLRAEGILPGDRLLLPEECSSSLLLHSDRRLARELAAWRLGALEGLGGAARERLEATLLAWLKHQGRVEAVARALHVHPQTVRYRLARLRELFGEALDDGDARFELELALRATASRG